jgi:hypothetical protein
MTSRTYSCLSFYQNLSVLKGRRVSTHLLVHQPERERFIAHQSLVMALCIGDTFLAIAPVRQCMDDITHVPRIILHVLEELDPLVRNCHGEAVVKTNAPDVRRGAKKRHPRHIFSDGDDIGEERMQSVVCL